MQYPNILTTNTKEIWQIQPALYEIFCNLFRDQNVTNFENLHQKNEENIFRCKDANCCFVDFEYGKQYPYEIEKSLRFWDRTNGNETWKFTFKYHSNLNTGFIRKEELLLTFRSDNNQLLFLNNYGSNDDQLSRPKLINFYNLEAFFNLKHKFASNALYWINNND